MPAEAILVVDDNKDDLFLLTHALHAAGIVNPVHTVDTGLDAIRYLEGTGKFGDRAEHPYPRVLLLDLHLPFQGGFGVLEWLSRHPQPELKVVVCTGTAAPQEVQKAVHLGAEHFLEKTPDFAAFIHSLESVAGVRLERCPVSPLY